MSVAVQEAWCRWYNMIMVTYILLTILFIDVCTYFYGAGRIGWTWPVRAIRAIRNRDPQKFVIMGCDCGECQDLSVDD